VGNKEDFVAIRDEMQAQGLTIVDDFVDFGINSDLRMQPGYTVKTAQGIIVKDLSLYRNRKTPPPPSTIPDSLFDEYTLHGEIPVLYTYYQDDIGAVGGDAYNTRADYERAFARLEEGTFEYYAQEMNSFYTAFSKYSFEGKTVLIWGLQGLNCEAMALWQGARHVYVVDYNKPICEHPQITVMNHDDLKREGVKTDIAISFSSFEHDGLGRYGDPLNPNGDIEAMQTARDALKEGGLLWLGVPQGEDCLVWNSHRIYGKKRLALLLEGWHIEESFYTKTLAGLPLGEYTQPLMILRKI
jgi:hypothetical protein